MSGYSDSSEERLAIRTPQRRNSFAAAPTRLSKCSASVSARFLPPWKGARERCRSGEPVLAKIVATGVLIQIAIAGVSVTNASQHIGLGKQLGEHPADRKI